MIYFKTNFDGGHVWYDLYHKKGVDTPVDEEKEVKEDFIKEEEFKV